MRVITQYDVLRARVNVYVEAGPGYWLTPDNEHIQIEPGTEPPRYLSLPERVADALKLELDGGREPAINRHLDDAIAVRDRLLTMVEGRIP